MAAVLIPAAGSGLPHVLRLPEPLGAGTVREEVRYGLGVCPPQGNLILQAGAWRLDLPTLQALQSDLLGVELRLVRVESTNPETLVAAASMGLPVERSDVQCAALPKESNEELVIHRGTLRSGDHLQVEGSLLLLGDVNPGARVTAGGRVLVWGRLRGVAQAGCHGDQTATITALQLRPLQLRIADAVARGPSDQPPPGFTETAQLINGAIEILPAAPIWPFSG